MMNFTANDTDLPARRKVGGGEMWYRSLSWALLLPFSIWALVGAVTFFYSPANLIGFLLIGSVALVIHFAAYLIIGLPFYKLLWRRAPLLWRQPLLGMPLGALLGGMSFWIFTFLLGADAKPTFVIGAIYGWLTALGGSLAHQKFHRNRNPNIT